MNTHQPNLFSQDSPPLVTNTYTQKIAKHTNGQNNITHTQTHIQNVIYFFSKNKQKINKKHKNLMQLIQSNIIKQCVFFIFIYGYIFIIFVYYF